MVKIRYYGPWHDPSGYGAANRNFITSLFLAGVDVTTEGIAQMTERTGYGWQHELCEALENRQTDYKIQILHATPDLAAKSIDSSKYNIFHLFWETDRLPKEWVGPCNKAQEIWTASEQQAQMIKNSGVTTLISSFPQPLETTRAEASPPPFIIPNFDGFVFYSIFQWIERKNPKALLTAYWKAFEGVKDVVLVLKTYRVNYTEGEDAKIKAQIAEWKRQLNQVHYPRVYLVTRLLTTADMFRLHKLGNVFISPSRGEGWCIPAVEASLMGNPVVSINQTGFADIFPKDIYYPINCAPGKIIEERHIPWYQSDQNWLNINPEDLISALKDIYNNPTEAKERGKKASAFVKENFNYFTVGQKMKERLLQIQKFL